MENVFFLLYRYIYSLCYTMSEKTVGLRIPTAREKLQVNFPQDPKGDFKLVFQSNVFNLQKAYLRLESAYFKRVCTSKTNIHEIKEDFNGDFFYNIMRCFYGATIQVPREDLPHYYSITRFLEIESLIQFIQNDILQHIEQHQLFVIMKIAHQYQEQNIYEVCLEQLEKQSFQQLNYSQYQLLQTEPALFKYIIKMHNRFKTQSGAGLSYLEIDKLLREYCESHGMREEKYHEFKFQLIDRTILTSMEYKEIFLDQAIKMKNKASFVIDSPQIVGSMVNPQHLHSGSQPSLASLVPVNKLSESFISSQQKSQNPNMLKSESVSNQLTLEMEVTFERKLNQELREENKKIAEQLEKLRQATCRNQDIHQQMQNELRILKEQIKKKEAIEKEHKKSITRFQGIISKMEKDLEEKSESIERLCGEFQHLRTRKPLDSSEDESIEGAEEPEMIVQSQFLPAHLITHMISPPKSVNKGKPAGKQESSIQPNESVDEEELEEMYMARLEFDQQPISTAKIHLPKLAAFISGEDFKKKRLNLIYRRSSVQPNKGKNTDIREKGELLILIKTSADQNIGGYITTSIPGDIHDESISDSGALIFTLTKNQKFQVKRSEVNEAIFMSELYLVSFANDLMISNDCIHEESYCSWPSSYEAAKNIKERGVSWFVGGGENFLIKQLQIYEIQEEQMQMML